MFPRSQQFSVGTFALIRHELLEERGVGTRTIARLFIIITGRRHGDSSIDSREARYRILLH
ncbi:hypothetical protein PI95_031020 [Hassallia byssoidea VB512170]|uniref:Uncharacterized protein n=1 Tax=Hassallia byssoidea VB512170 TaxID=1304833 RepID=A0A846HHK8_9CYAN|nr:hypothetical protein [Hassalia byssoidea]NEU76822.1 hypothetical protein [Hassalia byssoidea VB512170]